ncbi:MAG: hypothetical protein EBT20_04380 [Alphaproteobacteria bacterium]|nr:hypothetical protein [Alphaproteobacteria bacterium]
MFLAIRYFDEFHCICKYKLTVFTKNTVTLNIFDVHTGQSSLRPLCYVTNNIISKG